jgi:glyoxylase-like metal-dependent hydrolase (beta-lactamase superfamily II)
MREIFPGLWDIDEIGSMVHAYAWVWAEGVTLIDTGTPKKADVILAALASQGFQPSDVRRILITHVDIDHVGSLKALKRATGAAVACHAVERAWLQNPTRRKPAATPLGYLVRPLYEVLIRTPLLHMEPVTPDETYVDGAVLPEGLTLLHTPGHTPGHISLLSPQKRVLIAGDALNHWGGKLGMPPALFTPDMDNAQRSIWRLWKKHGREFDGMVFGHGDPVMQGAGEKLKALIDTLYETQPG